MSRKRKGREVSGWLCLDKAVGQTSTDAVASVKRLFGAAKVGHAGTLDPLATGVLPIALGEATKTVPFVQDGRKVYRFTVRWGVETDTDDAEGTAVGDVGRAARPCGDRAALPDFTGEIMQRPPAFSAIKIDGERAYDLARGASRSSSTSGRSRSIAWPSSTARPRPRRPRGRMRQGHLRPRARPRPRPPARLPAAMSSRSAASSSARSTRPG